MNGHAIVRMAKAMAEVKHFGVCRKGAGEPYFEHVQRVADACYGWKAKTVAYLHDIVEDTDVTESDLATFFPEEIVEAVMAITKKPFKGQSMDEGIRDSQGVNNSETYREYIERVSQNELATQVKIADLKDNMRDLDELPSSYAWMKGRYNMALSFLLGEDVPDRKKM